jgi:acyl dehydratase
MYPPRRSGRSDEVTWASLEFGQVHAAFNDKPLTIDAFVRHQGASRGVNPIHRDPDLAQASGSPGGLRFRTLFTCTSRRPAVLGRRLRVSAPPCVYSVSKGRGAGRTLRLRGVT